ncbi:MAG TPA: permease prefix domain 2-containing transporter [Microvirga sp.]|jgi:hypothetical protein|nr:permease prefix domain 2-containing transporter [Microvirga sp.]
MSETNKRHDEAQLEFYSSYTDMGGVSPRIIGHHILPVHGRAPAVTGQGAAIVRVMGNATVTVKAEFIPGKASATEGADTAQLSGHVENPAEPPALAEVLTRLLARPKYRDAIIGDREEKFRVHVAKWGRKRAVRMYWTDTLSSIGPQLYSALKRLGWFGAIVAGLKGFFGG